MKRSIYKRSCRSGARKGKPELRWTIVYQLANGRMREERAFSDKAASEQLLARREREVAQGIVGLSDPHREQKRRPIAEHVDDYLRKLAGENCSDAWCRKVKRHLLRAFEATNVRTLADLTMDAVSAYLDGLVADRGLSLSTRNQHASTLHAFGQFLHDRERLRENPLAKVEQVKVTDRDRTHEPRVLTAPELARVVEAAPLDRRRLYLFAAYTGFRRGEDKATTWADLSIDGDAPTVTIRDTKNGDTVTVNLPPWLAQELRQYRAETMLRLGGKLRSDRPVFHVASKIPHRFRQDAAKAGLGTVRKIMHRTPAGNRWSSFEWVDPAGPKVRLDFHDLRAFFCTLLFEQNVPLHEVKRLCRHASIRTTEKHYTAWREARLRDHVDAIRDPRLPVPAPVASVPNQSAAVRPRPDTDSAQGGQTVAR